MIVALASLNVMVELHEVGMKWRRMPLAIVLASTFVTIVAVPSNGVCAEKMDATYDLVLEPPSLPGDERTNPKGAVNVDAGNITIRDRAPDTIVGVRLDGYQAVRPSVA